MAKKLKILKVVARAGRIISDRHALEAGARRFVGRGHFPSLTLSAEEKVRLPSFVDKPGVIPPRKLPFVEVRHHHDYVHALRHGDLVAVDEETAQACGVKFQPELLEESEILDEDSGVPRVALEGEFGDLEAHAAAEAKAKVAAEEAAAKAKADSEAKAAAEAAPGHVDAEHPHVTTDPAPPHGSES
jgi:hypothetical protein